jgi:eukaryotic-like serine/threonine-protein kinase
MALPPGRHFGNFTTVRLLGDGGFGEVYLANNPMLDRHAAIKVMHPHLAQDDVLVKRFINEARAVAKLQHPNIVQVFDAGLTPDQAPYMVMEFLSGETLRDHLKRAGRRALPEAMNVVAQAGAALSAAHAIRIIHRDLKPENMFLVPDESAPGGTRVKVLDFGIAKVTPSRDTSQRFKTETGAIMGSPPYMSPEQCRDSSEVDARTDIYALATIAYEMLAGRTPHVAPSAAEFIVQHLMATPPQLRHLVPGVPSHVDAAIMRGLARDREARFADMAAFLDALLTPSGKAGLSAAGDQDPIRPRVATRTSPDGQPPAAPPAVTTFSRTTGEMVTERDPDPVTKRRRAVRWGLVGIGVASVAGLLTLALSRPGREPPRRPVMVGPAAQDLRPVEPAKASPPSPTAPAPADPSAPPPRPVETVRLPDPEPDSAAPPPALTPPRREGKGLAAPKSPSLPRRERGARLPSHPSADNVAGF